MKMKLTPAALATLILASGLATGAFAQDRKTYIVQLKDEPAASYTGTVAGLTATQPAAGQTFKYGAPAVQSYINYLGQQQSKVLAVVGSAPVLATYKVVFNGFAASLTDDEARALASNSLVAGLWLDQPRKLDTISTSRFLKLSEPGGLWSRTAGGAALKGENLVIGVIDGGIWPENPAFFDRVKPDGTPSNNPGDALAYGPVPATFSGACVASAGINPAKHCNNKLVGIKYYNTGFKASKETLHWTDFADSGRDSLSGATGHGGHGDHTASTAAGNSNVPVVINGTVVGIASGMAPRARIAAYKVCWTYVKPDATDGTGSKNSCYTSDSVAAIDAAVADGVNVINYSISGSQTSVNDPVEQAFYRASLAGVFVAASAGNDGPGQAVAHISPWLTTVAASTHDRAFSGSATVGGVTYTGGSTTKNGLPSTDMILAENAGIGGGNASLCFSASPPAGQVLLDPAKVAGKLVVCTRGTNARVDKGDAVRNAGGKGMILVNASAGQTLDSDFQSVPTVQVSNTDGAAIKNYVASTGSPKGVINPAVLGSKPAPIMADFSSRGPNAGDGNVLKPDLTAPGVDIIAQVTPAQDETQKAQIAAGTLVPPPAWDSYNGTSMSSPHVAGLALLLKQANPTWGPGAIKSALMTTTYSTLDDGLPSPQNGLLPWAQGAGHVDPQKAADPGLVYNAGKNDWVKYQCKVNKAAVQPASDCTTIGTLDETYNLNLPSITVGSVTGSVVVQRSVTNVGASSATYSAAVKSPPGFTTSVSPTSLTLAPGETKTFTVSLTPAGAAEGVWQFGQLVWNDGVHAVRSPIQARAGKAISAPVEFTDTKTFGSKLFTVRTGFSGRMGAIKGGLKDVTMGVETSLSPLATSSSTLATRCRSTTNYASIAKYDFALPAGVIVARWALRQADVGSADDDHDMIVVNMATSTSSYSGNDGSDEAVQIVSPAAGSYRVCVLAYGGTAPMKHRLSSWIVSPNDPAGLLTALPSQVYAGGSATVGLVWSGVPAGKRTVGGAQWLDASGVVQATTVLRVSTDGSVPVQNVPSNMPGKRVDATLKQ
ncbi:S8 family serine peptidase [Roseateles cellulosilyticus]|uniref:S8 family serine peptidase n=1 Tax=Pelomonas cellulosilytica TaxID=2906762 RepID=A0ABS8XLM1_9BURK|nr:S8 family serine peptidase [Pelomonas sp. P8]MCE4553706.1 S8 family serine peptidase [Pelomonas sp. P8]